MILHKGFYYIDELIFIKTKVNCLSLKQMNFSSLKSQIIYYKLR